MSETVTRLRAPVLGDRDRYGNPVRDWPAADRLDIVDCWAAPRIEGEDRDQGREGVVIGWTVYAPDGADVVATDRVEVRGVEHDVDGEPGDWSGGSGWAPGVELQLRKVAG